MLTSIPYAVFKLNIDDTPRTLVAGGIIGRAATMHMRINHPAISEAHALLSLRGGNFYLLALRGGLAASGQSVTELKLAVDCEVQLTSDITVKVVELNLPDYALGIEVVNGHIIPLMAEVSSLMPGSSLVLMPGWNQDAMGWIFSSGAGWTLMERGRVGVDLQAGQHHMVGGLWFSVVSLPASGMQVSTTEHQGRVFPAMAILFNETEVRIDVPGRPPVDINGVLGRILAELARFGKRVPWTAVFEAAFEEPPWPDIALARKRWDSSVFRIRARLRDERLRVDLLYVDGQGNVELRLYPGDTLNEGQ